jgi:two-component system, cell cycle response regulator
MHWGSEDLLHMPGTQKTTYLLASHEPALLAALEPVLTASGAEVRVVLTAADAEAALLAPESPALALLDARLPSLDLGRLLAAVRAQAENRVPIVLISDTIPEELKDRLAEGVLNDVFPTHLASEQLLLRLLMVLRADSRERELESMREAAARGQQIDCLTGIYSRDTILSLLFRETDRVQRMNTALSIILLDIDDFGHWNSRLGPAACDQLLIRVAERTGRLLRSYDLLGRVGKDEFLSVLPGCSAVNALLQAERMRAEVFAAPFSLGGRSVRLSACFGIAPSLGRSPVVVLREAEEALRVAREAGPETIHCAAGCPQPPAAPVAFLSPTSGDEFLAW